MPRRPRHATAATTADREVMRPNPGPQTAFLSTLADIAIFGGSAGCGKRLRVDEPIPTPSGWTAMGDLKRGDTIFGSDGKPCRVLHAHEKELAAECYRIVFDDGTAIEADAEHLWLTFDSKELGQLTRLDDARRQRRRARRKSRATFGRGVYFSSVVIDRNRSRVYDLKPKPTGTVRTTREIADTLLDRRGRRNHAVPVAGALDLPYRRFALKPYLLGVWLGDGSTASGDVTTADQEILTSFREAGYPTRHRDRYTHTVEGLSHKLRMIGVLGSKHVPRDYLRGSRAQRLGLLRGLMDSDGTASKDGSVSFTNTNEKLVRGFCELVASLGWKFSCCRGTARLDGRDCGPVWDVFFAPDRFVFRLARKKARQKLAVRRTGKFRYVVSCSPCQPSLMRCITVDSPDGLYLAGRSMVPTHNTRGLLMEAMRHYDLPDYRATLFRRTLKQIEKQGSLWDSSEEIYPRTGAVSNLNRKTWTWPSGAQVQMAGLEYDKSVENYLGAQIDMLGFDELVSFGKKQFFYLFSRNRGRSGVPPYVRATTNPDADSWVAEFISWWINPDTGYPIARRSGKIRHLAVVNDKTFWGDTREDLIRDHGPKTLTKTVTFIPARLEDNPPLLANNPGYEASLNMLSSVDRLRLKEGNWKVRAEAGKVFSRFWFKEAALPPGGVDCRFFDLASTKKSLEKDDPDFSAGAVCRKVGTAYFFYGCVAVQEAPAEVEGLMERTARQDALRARRDGAQYRLRFEIEPGSASVREAVRLYAKFAGLDVRGITPREQVNEKAGKWDKVARAGGLASQARAGNVYVCKNEWLQGDSCIDLDQFLAELHGFPDRAHDDVPDSASSCFHCLPNFMVGGVGSDSPFTVGPSLTPDSWGNW